MKFFTMGQNFIAVRLVGAVGVSVALLASGSRALEIRLPTETAALVSAEHPGYREAMTYCATCHSAEYLRMQPPNMTPAYWKATVLKMKKAFGAPIPDDRLDAITDYIVKTYGSAAQLPPAPSNAASAPKKSNE